MFHSRFFRQFVSLVLALIIAALPLQSVMAATPTVALHYSGKEAGVGDILTFTLVGKNTAAVQLMVVTPDSKQVFLPGEEVKYKIEQPGKHIFIAYGTTTTDTSSPAYQLCMSTPLIIDCKGPALEGSVTFEVMTDEGWEPLQDCWVYCDEGKEPVYFRAILDPESIPDDTTITVTLHAPQGKVKLMDRQVGSSTSWSFTGGSALPTLFDEEYGYWNVALEAVLSAEGTEDDISSENFVLDTFNNEMRYVNQVYNGDFVGYSGMGEMLLKWLDMSERPDSDRFGSGYLLLEQDYKDHSWWLPQTALNISKFFSRALELVGSLGLVLAIEHFTEADYVRKFGPEGKKVVPYYSNLTDVYQNYLAEMLQEMEQLEFTARLTAELSENMNYWAIGSKAAHDASETTSKVASLVDTIVYTNKFEASDHFSCYLGTSSHKGEMYELIVTDVSYPTVTDPLARVTDSPLIHWQTADGRYGSTYLDEMAASVLANGDDYYLVSSADLRKRMTADEFNNLVTAELDKGVLPYSDPTNPMWGADTVTLERTHGGFNLDTDGKLHFTTGGKNVVLDPDVIDKLGLYGSLSPLERSYIDDYKVLKAAAESPDQITAARKRGRISNAITLATSGFNAVASWVNFVSTHKELSWQLNAYYTIIAQSEIKYWNMLEEWRESVHTSGLRNAELVDAALDALIDDIQTTSADTLEEMQKNIRANASADADLFASKAFVTAMYDSIMLAKDIAAITGLTGKLSAILAQKAAAGLTSIRSALHLQSTTSAAATVAAGASTLSSFLGTVNMLTAFASIGSMIAGMITDDTFSFEENLNAIYDLKSSLYESIIKMLEDYPDDPTPQKATDIITSLEMMRSAKISGEDLCIMWRLMDLFDDLEIDGARAQLVLWNELHGLIDDLEGGLHWEDYLTDVHIIYENTYLGTVREMKEKHEGIKFDELGIFEREKESAAIGATIVGLYTRNGSSGSYQGMTLSSLPSVYSSLPSTREAAGKFGNGNYAWARLDAGEDPAWMTDGPYSNTAHLYRKEGYLYSRNGLELAISPDEYEIYLAAQKEINEILNKYLHADEDRFFMPEDQKHYRNLLSGVLTRTYIKVFPMYDPTIEYP